MKNKMSFAAKLAATLVMSRSVCPSRQVGLAGGFLKAAGPSVCLGLLLMLGGGSFSSVQAQDDFWSSSTGGTWQSGTNWSLGAPSNNPNIYINNAGIKTVTIDASTPAANLTITNLWVGGAANTLALSNTLSVLGTLYLGNGSSENGSLVINGGQLTNVNSVVIGWNGVGSMAVSNGAWLDNGITYVGTWGGSRGTLSIAGGGSTLSQPLHVGYSAGATGTVTMTGGQLVVNNTTYFGESGVGNMAVSNGTWLGQEVQVGVSSGSRGTLSIAGGGSTLSGILYMGYSAGSTGTVTMTGGQLTNANSVAIGWYGVGSMAVSNGTWLDNGNTYVGTYGGSRGTLEIAGGSSTLSQPLHVGFSAGTTGTITMTGGQLVVPNTMYLGESGVGNMTVSNGTWLGQGVQVGVNSGSQGTLSIAGGTNVLSSYLALGWNAGAIGTVTMTGGQLVVTNGTTYIGASGIGNMAVSNGTWLGQGVQVGMYTGSKGTLTISGGSNVFSSFLYVGENSPGATGAVTMSDGYLSTPTLHVGQLSVASVASVGSFLLSGGAVLETPSLVLQTTGSAVLTNQAGGVLQFTTNAPTVNLVGGHVVVTNAVISYRNVAAADIYNSQVSNITFQGNNAFRLNNSTNSFIAGYTFATNNGQLYQDLQLVGVAPTWQSGVLTVGSGGQLLVSNAGAATVAALFTNAGAVQVVNSSVAWQSNVVLNSGSSYLSQNSANTFTNIVVASGASFLADALSQVTVNGSYQNLGSSVFSNLLTVGSSGSYVGNGTTNQFAGLNIQSGGAFLLNHGASTVGGAVSNAGVISVTNSVVIYRAPVLISGGYISDPSTNIFTTNVTVMASGYLQGGSNDQFVFYGDLSNQSTNRIQFNLSQALVLFTNGNGAGSTNHTFNLVNSGAVDKGSNWLNHTQLATNFSIGTLTIASGNRLMLTGDQGTNALYVGRLDLSAWDTSASGLTNTLHEALSLQGLNLYYDKYDLNNAYLDGQVYDFSDWGAGQSLLIPIPEPSATALVFLGSLALLAIKRRC